ncbi:MAG: AbfB domain-containing protein [Pseudomonadota bacterium]
MSSLSHPSTKRRPVLGFALTSVSVSLLLGCGSGAGDAAGGTTATAALSRAQPLAVRDSLPIGQYRSLQVTTPGFTTRFLRHQDGLGYTEVVNSGSTESVKQDATFKITAGLADANCFSFEARNQPGSFLRHQDFRIKLAANDNTGLFRNDATFCARDGLSGTGVSFESKNLPGAYLRHIDSQVWLAKEGGGHSWDASGLGFKPDVSWNVVDGLSGSGGGGGADAGEPAGSSEGRLTADFNQGAAVNLVKMFGMFNSAFVTPDRWERDIGLAKNLAPVNGPLEIRWELPIGTEDYTGWERLTGRDLNRDCNSNNYGPLDRVVRVAQNNGINLLPALGYSPERTGPVRPSDFNAWADKVAGCFTRHWQSFNNIVGYEIWNEPDLGPFGQFNSQQYTDLYNTAVPRINGKPVMGPAVAAFFDFNNWMLPFLNGASRLDVYTFHKYGPALEDVGAINGIRDNVRGRGKGAKLTEWNYKHGPFSKDKNVNSLLRLDGARELLINLRDFASVDQDLWLDKVHWAQLQEPGCVLNDDGCDRIGLLNVRGKRRPTYYAFQMYNKMPVSRKRLDAGAGIDGYASKDGDHAAVVLWNNEGRDKIIDLAMPGAPGGTYYVYSLDFGSNSLKAGTNGNGDVDGNNYTGDDTILVQNRTLNNGVLKLSVRDSAVVFVTNRPLPGL